MFYPVIKPFLMKMDPESAHNLAVKVITSPLAKPVFGLNRMLKKPSNDFLKTDLCGIPLANPVGLAAGFDKNGEMFPHLHNLGFGFIEVGTVTGLAQPGNEKPRLFRLIPDQALINRMGFNNEGAEKMAERLAASRSVVPLGGNIGKSKATPLEDAKSDYEKSFKLLKPHVDYFVVNVSSPNTPNLRKLQEREPLMDLLRHLMALNENPKLPLLLKIAPDLNEAQLEDIVAVVDECGLHGVIATNTTISRENLSASVETLEQIGAGGVSGAPVRDHSTQVLRFLRRNLPEHVDLVGVGGIFNGAHAYEKIRAGAKTVQIYTGLIYQGPGAVFRILKELEALLRRDGFSSLSEAVGSEA